MKLLILLSIIFLNHCSLNSDSAYWTEGSNDKKQDKEKLSKALKKSDSITTMTLEEYEIYIEDYTKKSNYPDISK